MIELIQSGEKTELSINYSNELKTNNNNRKEVKNRKTKKYWEERRNNQRTSNKIRKDKIDNELVRTIIRNKIIR